MELGDGQRRLGAPGGTYACSPIADLLRVHRKGWRTYKKGHSSSGNYQSRRLETSGPPAGGGGGGVVYAEDGDQLPPARRWGCRGRGLRRGRSSDPARK